MIHNLAELARDVLLWDATLKESYLFWKADAVLSIFDASS